jgi:hypothetical protein
MDNTDIKIISTANYEGIATTQATSNCKQTPDQSAFEIYEKQNLLLIENDNDIKY